MRGYGHHVIVASHYPNVYGAVDFSHGRLTIREFAYRLSNDAQPKFSDFFFGKNQQRRACVDQSIHLGATHLFRFNVAIRKTNFIVATDNLHINQYFPHRRVLSHGRRILLFSSTWHGRLLLQHINCTPENSEIYSQSSAQLSTVSHSRTRSSFTCAPMRYAALPSVVAYDTSFVIAPLICSKICRAITSVVGSLSGKTITREPGIS